MSNYKKAFHEEIMKSYEKITTELEHSININGKIIAEK